MWVEDASLLAVELREFMRLKVETDDLAEFARKHLLVNDELLRLLCLMVSSYLAAHGMILAFWIRSSHIDIGIFHFHVYVTAGMLWSVRALATTNGECCLGSILYGLNWLRLSRYFL